MSVMPSPAAREVQEFQFRLLARLRVFDDYKIPLKQPLGLVAASSKFGLLFYGTKNGFGVIESRKVVELSAGVRKPAAEVSSFPRRSIDVGASPSHLDVSCDNQHLAVGYTHDGSTVLRVYDVTSFMAQAERVVNEVRMLAPIQVVSWNPGIPNLLAVCLQDGSAAVYDFKANSFQIYTIPAEAQATCLCWSPKGKQIVIGSKNGNIHQFKPDLKIVKAIPPPQGDLSVVNVHWLGNIQYAAVYSTSTGTSPSLFIINTPKGQPITYINYDDITYSNGDQRLTQFYLIHQQTWNVVLVASANSMEVGVLGLQGADWEQWQLDDAARAELPLSSTRQETLPVGMALDLSSQYNLPWGENQQLSAMPLLAVLSHEGLLSLYWTINVVPDAANVCIPPTPFPDTSGLHLFITPQPLQPPPSQQQSPPLEQPQPVSQAPVPSSVPEMTPPLASVPPQPQQGSPAPGVQWQPPTTAQTPPKSESGAAPGSWMTSPNLPSLFVTALNQPRVVPPPPTTTAAPTTSAFSTLSTPPTVQQTAPAPAPAPASAPFSFSPQQPSFSFANPVVPVASIPSPASVSAPATVSVVPASTSTPLLSTPLPQPVIPRVDLPVTVPSTPEPEPADEESEELQKMKQALINEAIQEEFKHCEQIMAQHRQRVRSFNTNFRTRMDNCRGDSLAADIQKMEKFMKRLKETTLTHQQEVSSLRNFLLDAFSYIESMKTRLRLESNPEFWAIHSPQGLDPIQSRRMADIKRNIQTLECTLSRIQMDLSSKWSTFCDSNKENRTSLHIPTVESIYQAMVVHNNVLMNQRAAVDELEEKVKARSRSKLTNMINQSRSPNSSQLDNTVTHFSRVAEDFLNLNLSKYRSTALEDLEKSVSNLVFSEKESEKNLTAKKDTAETMEAIYSMFSNREIRQLETSSVIQPVYTNPHRRSKLPIVSSTPQTGSISSGQPLIQSKPTSPKPIAVTDNANPKTTMSSVSSAVQSAKNVAGGETNNYLLPKVQTTLGSKMTTFQSPFTNSQNNTPPATFSFSTSAPAANAFKLTTNTTQQNTFVAPSTTTASKGFSFAPLSTNQSASAFSSTPIFGSNLGTLQAPVSSASQTFVTPLAKPFSFSLAATTASVSVPNVQTTSFAKSESPKSQSPGVTGSSFKVSTSDNVTVTNSASSPQSPLASLSSFVFGMEKPSSESKNKFPVASESAKTTQTQPFTFKLSNVENKGSPNKTNSKDHFSATEQKENAGLVKNIFGEGFKVASFESSPPKSIFGGSSFSSGSATAKPNQVSKNLFTSLNTNPSPFGTSNVVAATHQPSSSEFGEIVSPRSISAANDQQREVTDAIKVTSTQPDNISPIIEVSLSPSTALGDPKESLEKLSASKSITVTKQGSPEEKLSSAIESQNEPDNAASSMFSSLNLSSFTTPTKTNQNIFGGSSTTPKKPSVMYEVTTPEKSTESVQLEQKVDSKPPDTEKQPDKTPDDLSLKVTDSKNNVPAATFSFTIPTETSISSSTQSVQKDKTPEFTFDLKGAVSSPAASTVSATTSSPAASTFSFAQAMSQPASTAFSFTLTTTSTPTTASSTFGFGNLTTGFSDDKSKSTTGFSFGQQTQSAVSSGTSIFGGFSSKPVGTASIFGQSTTTTSTPSTESKSIFGQNPPVSTGAKNIFGQETKSLFGPTPSTAVSETKSLFGQPTVTDNKSIFGSPQTTASETKSLFGQPQTTVTETKNIFGQSQTTATETKSIFGQSQTTVTETKSIFGQSQATPETKNIFGQPTADKPIDFSFSLSSVSSQPSTQSTTQSFFNTPTPATSSQTSFFGQPVCSPSSTAANSPFGQAATSVFGSSAPAAASPSPFGGKPMFGQSVGSFFGQSGGFGSSGGSVFGGASNPGGSPSIFGGSTTQPSSPFGQATGGSGSVFGGGSFSSGGSSVGQTGFGTAAPAFTNKPAAFGSTSPPAFGGAPAFGSAPTFGGAPAFGSPPKLFGSPASSPAPAPAFGASPQQQSPTFENLATQNTMTFGNLAQNQPTAFGSVFATPQNTQQAPPSFPQASNNSMFGGSSFSSWR